MRATMLILIVSLLCGISPALAQRNPVNHDSGVQPAGRKVTGQRKYTLIVNEGNDSTISEFNRGLANIRNNQSNRGFLDNLAGIYKSTAAGQAISLTSNILNWGVNTLVNATKSKRGDWEKAVRNESLFIRKLPMQMEILDFYKNPSINGPLDPTDMNFNGFGCRQVIEYVDPEGDIKEKEVFYVSCKVKNDDAGKARMLHHSKFQIEIDTLRFNYAICDLPNDSLGIENENRIGFSFDKRNDLKFSVKATITSSWINQALMVFKDEVLGSFEITASIDPNQLDDDGIFRYYAGRDNDSGKKVKVSGECFLVPRSYVGSPDLTTVQDSWGTGQYRVEMDITESCRINESGYKTDGKWNNNWKDEWTKIKRRRRHPSVWKQLLGIVTSGYQDSKWITVVTEPLMTTLIQYEKDGLTRLMNPGTTITGTKQASSGGQGTQGGSSNSGKAGGGNPSSGASPDGNKGNAPMK